MRTRAACFALGIFLGGCVVGSSTGSTNNNVIGGTEDSGDPAVGLIRGLRSDGFFDICTATVISPRVLITAAHCAGDPLYEVSFAPQPNLNDPLGSSGWTAGAAIASPDYSGDPTDGSGHDVALVILREEVAVTPIALGATPAAGATVRTVGYGMNTFGQDGTGIGVKRELAMPVVAVTEHEIITGSEGASTCHGDSGGPFFDAAGNLVATTSWGDANCHGSGHEQRVDDNLDFITPFLGL